VTTNAPRDDHSDLHVRVSPPETWATGLPAIAVTVKRSQEETRPLTALRSLLKVNHVDGFDCPGCAWPDPEHRKLAEFCENGAKHVAAEATSRRVDGAFFARHSVADLATRSDWWLEEQGRLVEPLVKRAGSGYYEPAGWDEALELVAGELRAHPTRPSSTRRGGRATRRRSCTSCSSGRSGPTTSPTAPTCATSRAAPP
jgi:anaerobic selenocysteine-containing dehydrogenase